MGCINGQRQPRGRHYRLGSWARNVVAARMDSCCLTCRLSAEIKFSGVIHGRNVHVRSWACLVSSILLVLGVTTDQTARLYICESIACFRRMLQAKHNILLERATRANGTPRKKSTRYEIWTSRWQPTLSNSRCPRETRYVTGVPGVTAVIVESA
jgi:hypothetical protein